MPCRDARVNDLKLVGWIGTAKIACPDKRIAKMGLVADRFGAENIGKAVVIKIIDNSHLIERSADSKARPGAAGRAGVTVPPSPGDDILISVAVQIGRIDEYGAIRPGVVNHMRGPVVRRETDRRRWVRGIGGRGGINRWHQLIQPRIDTRCIPYIWLPEDIQIAVAIQISQTRFMIVDAGSDHVGREVALPVAIKNHRPRV